MSRISFRCLVIRIPLFRKSSRILSFSLATRISLSSCTRNNLHSFHCSRCSSFRIFYPSRYCVQPLLQLPEQSVLQIKFPLRFRRSFHIYLQGSCFFIRTNQQPDEQHDQYSCNDQPWTEDTIYNQVSYLIDHQ